jgi:RNA polymerase sigma-70 factor (ECF subfamily)
LLVRAQAKDPAAWNRLVSLYVPLVHKWLRIVGLQEADILDVGQNVFGAVAEKLRDFRHDPREGSFRGWLRVITSNKLTDFYRAQCGQEYGEGGSDHQKRMARIPEPGPQELTEETRLLYQRALELLREHYDESVWKVFLSVTVHDEAPQEVAQRLGLSANKVYKIRTRVLERFRREFAGLVPDIPAEADGT